MELLLASVWADVLGIDKRRLRPTSHFFDLGGTSLSAVQVRLSFPASLLFSAASVSLCLPQTNTHTLSLSLSAFYLHFYCYFYYDHFYCY